MKKRERRIKSLRITDVNKSHAACYSYITVLTGYFKTYYPAKFFAALLTMQDDEEKIEQYISVAKSLGINTILPNINLANENFEEKDGSIIFGIGSIKGIGVSSIPDIIANKPYESLSHAAEKLGKSFNKKVGVALIKAGAFEFESGNRFTLLNNFYDSRKDKDERYNEDSYSRRHCMSMEKEVLGTTVTYSPNWEAIKKGEKVNIVFDIKNVVEKTDKNGGLMAFIEGEHDGGLVKGVVFASVYAKDKLYFDGKTGKTIILKGKKDDKGQIIVSGAGKHVEISNDLRQIFGA